MARNCELLAPRNYKPLTVLQSGIAGIMEYGDNIPGLHLDKYM